MTVKGVLFDLDGTLVDTAPDLVAALNRLLDEAGRPPAPYALARNEASHGALGLLRFGFGAALPAAEREALRARFLEIYALYVCVKSRLFIDICGLLDNTLKSCPWGIVTNKPEGLTMPLLEQLGIARLTDCIVSGDSLKERKPHPAPLLFAADKLGLDPSQCMYVGDAERDVQAGRAAGMGTVIALWGYIRPTEAPARWAADLSVAHPARLEGILSRWIGQDHGTR